jgi:hypothetical protein
MATEWVTRESAADDWAVREEPEMSAEQEGTPSAEEDPPANGQAEDESAGE